MMGKRVPSEDERALFENALGDAVPLKRAPRRSRKPQPAKASERATMEKPTSAPAIAPSSPRVAGIDGNTAERLRRGLLEPQARIDLHGLSERAAHAALVTFLRSARVRKLRLVLVVTGKGQASRVDSDEPFDLGLDMQMRGILRTMTPRWLREPGLAELVADMREAHRRHGGAGALYVYLRKA